MEKKKEEKMPKEAKLLLEMVQKSGKQGVTREEMTNTPLGDLYTNPNGFDWLKAQKKIMPHVRIEENNDLVNAWVLYKEREGEELSEILKRISGSS